MVARIWFVIADVFGTLVAGCRPAQTIIVYFSDTIWLAARDGDWIEEKN